MAIKAVFQRRKRDADMRRKRKTIVGRLDDALLIKIFQCIQRDASVPMLDVCLVCRGWLPAARQVLYEHVWARSLGAAASLHSTLTSMPLLCNAVRYLEIPPIWLGTEKKSPDGKGGWTLVSFGKERWLSISEFTEYINKMRICALHCKELEEVNTSADVRYLVDIPRRAPRIDYLLDLSVTHKFLRRLQLDDGGMHKSSVCDIFPDSMKLDHLEELTLKNYAFVSPPRSQLFRGSPLHETEFGRRMAGLPRLKTLRLIQCTSDDTGLLPLTRQVSKSVTSLTIVQRKEKYACSEEGDGYRWHASFAHNDVFAPLSRRITHLVLGMDNYGPSYFLSLSSLRALHLRARKFYRAALTDLPRSIRHLSITVLDPTPDWTSFDFNEHDLFDDLAYMLSERSLMEKVELLRIVDIHLPSALRTSVKCWMKLANTQRLCRRGRVLLRITMDAKVHPWGVPLPPKGRVETAVTRTLPTPPSSSSPTAKGFKKMLGLSRK